ELRLPFLMVQM
ncbi:hypothetical protein D046_2102B, partial [Vibrio parahaemolyticus V-223/04]